MLRSEKSKTVNFRADYARRSHFCEVLEEEMESFYLLAFLLTGNHKDAEQCFVSTVDECFEKTSVFKDWTRHWIKRCLIRTAIRVASPTSPRGVEKRDPWNVTQSPSTRDSRIDAVTRLAPLERFVFVMSVLERYSAWDCSLLLGVSTSKVASAQLRALRRLPERATFFVGAEANRADGMQVVA